MTEPTGQQLAELGIGLSDWRERQFDYGKWAEANDEARDFGLPDEQEEREEPKGVTR
jgi:hypothetical protein